MKMLSDDDLNLEDMSEEELAAAWDLWFDLAQTTNDADPPYTHGVFVNLTWNDVAPPIGGAVGGGVSPPHSPRGDDTCSEPVALCCPASASLSVKC